MQDVELVRDQLLHFLAAERDSTASLPSWILWVRPHTSPSRQLTPRSFNLVRNRDTLARPQREIASVPRDGDIGREQINKLIFLRCRLCLGSRRALVCPPFGAPLIWRRELCVDGSKVRRGQNSPGVSQHTTPPQGAERACRCRKAGMRHRISPAGSIQAALTWFGHRIPRGRHKTRHAPTFVGL